MTGKCATCEGWALERDASAGDGWARGGDGNPINCRACGGTGGDKPAPAKAKGKRA